MYAAVAWLLVSSGTQDQAQIIIQPGYLPDYPFVSYDYDFGQYLRMVPSETTTTKTCKLCMVSIN